MSELALRPDVERHVRALSEGFPPGVVRAIRQGAVGCGYYPLPVRPLPVVNDLRCFPLRRAR